MSILSPLKLTFNPCNSYSGSGHLPHQPYLKMFNYYLTGGVRSWFRQVMSGVRIHCEPYAFEVMVICLSGDIAGTVDGVGWSRKPHLPVVGF